MCRPAFCLYTLSHQGLPPKTFDKTSLALGILPNPQFVFLEHLLVQIHPIETQKARYLRYLCCRLWAKVHHFEPRGLPGIPVLWILPLPTSFLPEFDVYVSFLLCINLWNPWCYQWQRRKSMLDRGRLVTGWISMQGSRHKQLNSLTSTHLFLILASGLTERIPGILVFCVQSPLPISNELYCFTIPLGYELVWF